VTWGGGLQVHITNTHLPTLEIIQERLGGRIYRPTKSDNPRFRPCHRLVWTGANAERVLATLAPLLREKRDQAFLALQARRLVKAEREPILAQLKALKKAIHP
jgi:hypothetical protein